MTEDELEATPTPKSRPRMTPKQWAEAEALWESGEVTLKDLSARFDKHPIAFSKHFNKYGIVKGSKASAHKEKVAAEVTRKSVDEATVVAARIKETKEEHYKMAAGLAKLTWSEILKAKQDGNPVASALNNLKALDTAMNVLKKAREERYAVLGLDRDDTMDEDGLPELVISELTAEQIQELRDRDESDLEDVASAPSRPDDDDEERDPDDDEVVEEL